MLITPYFEGQLLPVYKIGGRYVMEIIPKKLIPHFASIILFKLTYVMYYNHLTSCLRANI